MKEDAPTSFTRKGMGFFILLWNSRNGNVAEGEIRPFLCFNLFTVQKGMSLRLPEFGSEDELARRRSARIPASLDSFLLSTNDGMDHIEGGYLIAFFPLHIILKERDYGFLY